MTESPKIERRGGARKGAGRKPPAIPIKTRSIKLTDADWEKFRAIGGVSWLRKRLAEF